MLCYLSPQLCPTLCDPVTVALQAPRSMVILQAGILEWVACPPPGDPPNPEFEPRSPASQADPSPSEPPGKPFFRTTVFRCLDQAKTHIPR